MINTFMRFNEFKNPKLYPYTVIVVLSDHASAKTLVYADSPENAWLVACRQYGSENIVSVNSPKQQKVKPNSLEFWKNRFRKYAILSKIPNKYHMLFKTRRDKAMIQMNKLLNLK